MKKLNFDAKIQLTYERDPYNESYSVSVDFYPNHYPRIPTTRIWGKGFEVNRIGSSRAEELSKEVFESTVSFVRALQENKEVIYEKKRE